MLKPSGEHGQIQDQAVKVRALNEEMEEVIWERRSALARAFCHEIDHLSGQMYMRLAEDGIHDNVEEE